MKLNQENYYFLNRAGINRIILILSILFCDNSLLLSQSELTVVALDNPAPGYLFLQSNFLDYIGFVDNSGKVAYKKKLNKSEFAITLELQPNGMISYYSNNKFYLIDDHFNLIDSFACKNGVETDFHDFKLTSDGHAFLIGTIYDTVDMSIIVPGGKTDAVLRSSVIQEQDENKNVVWEWKGKDYFQITDVTSDIDLTWQQISWVHANWIEIDSDGNILLSSRNLDEITKINKQTGEIIWRLGGKECKNNQFTYLNDTVNGYWGFSHQHSIHRLNNGHLLLFDNGNQKPIQYSRAVEYEIDEINKTIKRVWEYRAFPEVFTVFQGSVQRLPNGTTLIGWGTNNQQMTFIEVRPDGSRAMEGRNFENYLALRYPVKMASKLIDVQNSGNYSFSDSSNKTLISLNISNMTGSGYVSVERHYYRPYNMLFSGTAPTSTYWHRWVLNNKGITNFSGKIKLKISEIDSLNSAEMNKIYWRANEGNGSFIQLLTTYNQSLGSLEADISSFGEFILGEPQLYEVPIAISPTNNSKKIPLDVDFSWNKVTGADSYKIQISENQNFMLNLADIITDDTNFRFIGFVNNKTYYWRLKSVYGVNESNWSNPMTFSTILKSPDLINPASGETEFPVNGLFAWKPVEGATYYKINISEASDFNSLVVDETGITDTSFSTGILDFNKNYYWRVKALNFDNESLWSDTIPFTTIEEQVLSSPDLLLPAKDTIDVPISGFLMWNPVPDAEKYDLELSLYPDFLSNIISANDIDSTSHYFSGLNYKTIYYWHVAAKNSFVTSSWSDTWSFTTKEFNLVFNNDDRIHLRIEKGIDESIYFKYYSDEAEEESLIIYDYLGNAIANAQNKFRDLGYKTIAIDAKVFVDGLYFYMMIVGSEFYQGKFIYIR